MAATLIKTNTNQRRFQDPLGMFVTPYVYDGSMNLNLGEITYDIHDIVGDTISLTQDDPDYKESIAWLQVNKDLVVRFSWNKSDCIFSYYSKG